jgi:hypothetical protein
MPQRSLTNTITLIVPVLHGATINSVVCTTIVNKMIACMLVLSDQKDLKVHNQEYQYKSIKLKFMIIYTVYTIQY